MLFTIVLIMSSEMSPNLYMSGYTADQNTRSPLSVVLPHSFSNVFHDILSIIFFLIIGNVF